MWFADDSTGAGKLKETGPKYGYYLKPSKTFLIAKNEELLVKAREIFEGEEIKLTADGHRHVGAVIGTEEFRDEFISERVLKWAKYVTELAGFAKEEPQAALCAFNTGLSQSWTFIQRTVQGVSALFEALEDVIRNSLIPAICWKVVSDVERESIALPYRYGT